MHSSRAEIAGLDGDVEILENLVQVVFSLLVVLGRIRQVLEIWIGPGSDSGLFGPVGFGGLAAG